MQPRTCARAARRRIEARALRREMHDQRCSVCTDIGFDIAEIKKKALHGIRGLARGAFLECSQQAKLARRMTFEKCKTERVPAREVMEERALAEAAEF